MKNEVEPHARGAAKFGAFFLRHASATHLPTCPRHTRPNRQSPAQAKQARSLKNLRHDARQFSTMKPLSFNTRRGSNRSRPPSIRACWKGIIQLAIVGILSTYAVGMWLGLRYALYSSDYETDTGGDQLVNNIKAIAILGERNSGTRWLWTHLNECFNHSIPVKRELVRYKHWFQSPDCNTSKIAQNTLVLTIFRNVYEWVEAMRKTPHHASNHLWLDWKTFVTRPWTMERTGGDLFLANQTGRICQEGFHYHEVVSCLKRPLPDEYWQGRNHSFSERQPFYELRLDGSGKPYTNILALRAAKIRNFLSTADFEKVSALWILRYEDLIKQGTSNLIQKLEAATGTSARCIPFEAQGDRHRRQLDMGMIKWLMKHVDWEAESLIGYHK